MAEKTKRLSNSELAALIDNELRQAYGYGDGKLEQIRRRNMYFFNGEAKEDLAPPEIQGRSKVVDTTVQSTVLGMEAALMKTFYGSDNVFEFEETKPGDEPKAKLISTYVNYIFRVKNPGYTITNTWIREALQVKAGIVKAWYDASDVVTREEYNGQTIEQIVMLQDDPEVEVIEQKAYEDEEEAKNKAKALEQASAQVEQIAAAAKAGDQQAEQQLMIAQQELAQFQAQSVPLLYDVTVKRTKKSGKVCIENVPPEEFLIGKTARSIKDGNCGHRFKRTISQLRASGYTLPDPLPSDDNGAELSMEREERLEYVDDDAYSQTKAESGTIDPSQREVWVLEWYKAIDYDGDGIPEMRKVVKCGTVILDNEEFDEPPFVRLGSILMPYMFYGMCPADQAIEPQKIKTSLKRGLLDNMYLQVNGRNYAVENQVNLDDLLSSSPGGVVRVKNPEAVGRLDQGIGDLAGAMQMAQYFEGEVEEQTGWTRQSQGGNGLQVDQTATQANIVTNRADARVESISRYMAETGFTELGNMILKLVCKYQKRAEMIKVAGAWVNVDPREWTNHFTLNVNVGLGTGNKGQLVQHLVTMGAKQVEGLGIGVTTPENVFRTNVRLANALGFKNGEEFFTDPNKMPPKQPQQDPEIAKIQAQDQQHAREMEMKAQQAIADREAALETERIKAQVQMEVDRNRQMLEAEQQRLKSENEMQLEILREQNRVREAEAQIALEHERLALEKYRIDEQNAADIVKAQISAKQANDAALAAAESTANEVAADGT